MLINLSILAFLALLIIIFLVVALDRCDKFEVTQYDKVREIDHTSSIHGNDTENL